jgi:hypothetical protein
MSNKSAAIIEWMADVIISDQGGVELGSSIDGFNTFLRMVSKTHRRNDLDSLNPA